MRQIEMPADSPRVAVANDGKRLCGLVDVPPLVYHLVIRQETGVRCSQAGGRGAEATHEGKVKSCDSEEARRGSPS